MSDEPKSQPTLGPGDLTIEAENQTTINFVAWIDPGLEPSVLLDISFLAHHAAKMRPWCRIEARAKDGSWFGDYLVLDCSRTWVKLKQLTHYKLTTADVSLSQASDREAEDRKLLYKIVHRGPRGWSVIREADKQVMHEDETTKEGAQIWLTKHVGVEVKGERANA